MGIVLIMIFVYSVITVCTEELKRCPLIKVYHVAILQLCLIPWF